ncbi:hypothetical protein GA0115245_13092, partial [Streptomyces sp. di188]
MYGRTVSWVPSWSRIRTGSASASRERGPGEQGERLRPAVVVHEVQVAHGDDLGGDGRDGRVGEAVEDVLGPHVDGVQQPGVVRLGVVALAGLQLVRVEDDVGGPHQSEVDEHPARGQRLLAPLPGQVRVHGGQLALPHDLREGPAGEDEFAGRGEFAVLVGQGEGAQPGLVAGLQARVPCQRQDDLGEFVGVERVLLPVHRALVVERRGDGGPHLRGGEHGTRGRGQRAQLLQERVDGVRVGDLQAEPGQQPGVEGRVGGGQQHLPGADRRAAVGQRHRESGQPVGVDPGEAVVQPPPPVGGLLQAGEPVYRVGQRHPRDPEGAQLRAPFEPGGQQRGQHLRQHPYGVGARAFDDFGVARAQRLGQPGVVVGHGRGGGRQEGGARQPLQDRRAQVAVQLALPERAGHEVDGACGHRTPVGEEPGVGVGGALHEEVGERAGGGVPAGGVQRQGGDEQGGHAERLVAGGGRVHDGAV